MTLAQTHGVGPHEECPRCLDFWPAPVVDHHDRHECDQARQRKADASEGAAYAAADREAALDARAEEWRKLHEREALLTLALISIGYGNWSLEEARDIAYRGLIGERVELGLEEVGEPLKRPRRRDRVTRY